MTDNMISTHPKKQTSCISSGGVEENSKMPDIVKQNKKRNFMPGCGSSSAPCPGGTHPSLGPALFLAGQSLRHGITRSLGFPATSELVCLCENVAQDRGHQPSQRKAGDTNTPGLKHRDIRGSLGQVAELQANISAPDPRKPAHHAACPVFNVKEASSSLRKDWPTSVSHFRHARHCDGHWPFIERIRVTWPLPSWS